MKQHSLWTAPYSKPEFSGSYLLSYMALFQLGKAESWRKKNTHSHSTNRACVRVASEWVVVGILYSTTHRLVLPIFVAPRQSGSPYIFPTLFEKIDLLFRTFLLSFYIPIFLPSFLSCKLKCSEHGSAFHHLGAWQNMMKSFL